MKIIFNKSISICFITILFITACNKSDEILENQTKDIEVIQNGAMLKFKDQATFDATLSTLRKMNRTQQAEWSKKVGFSSLQNLYDVAMNESNDMESMDDYQLYKQKYTDMLYFPEYQDDFGSYVPVSDEAMWPLLSLKGSVQIGDVEKSYIDISTYSELQAAGFAMYDDPEMLRAYQRPGVNSYVGTGYESGWEERGRRKLNVKVRRRVTYISDIGGEASVSLHIEISFRKKVAWSWVNHSCLTKTNLYLNGSNRSVYFEEDGHSSHDHYQPISVSWTPQPLGAKYIPYKLNHDWGKITVDYRDFGGYIKTCDFDLDCCGIFEIPTNL